MIYIQIAESIQPTTGETDGEAAGSSPVDQALLERAARQALEVAGGPAQADLSLVISDDAQLHQLNQQFLGVDAPTDVLSFPDGDIDPETGQPYLGDIILSLPRAAAQAGAGGHPVEAELQLLVVHGVLHLLGYDHAEEDEKAAMWALQARVLDSLGVDLRP